MASFETTNQSLRRQGGAIVLSVVAGALMWGIVIAAGLTVLGLIDFARGETVRDAMGREIGTVTRDRDGKVVVRDRFGREVLTQSRH